MPWWKAYGKALLVVVFDGAVPFGVVAMVIIGPEGRQALYDDWLWLLFLCGLLMLAATTVLAESLRRGEDRAC